MLIDDVVSKKRAPKGRYSGNGPYHTEKKAETIPVAVKPRTEKPAAKELEGFEFKAPSKKTTPGELTKRSVAITKFQPLEQSALWWHRNRYRMLSTLSVLAVVFSSYVAYDSVQANKALREQLAVLGANVTVDSEATTNTSEPNSPRTTNIVVPDETKPKEDEIANYTVAADKARYISIPRFETKARVFEVGRTAENAVDVPQNIHDTAWFDESASLSDDDGVAFILGHVSGVQDPGIFFDMYKLVVGDRITVELGNGRVKTFEVTSREHYPVDEVDMRKVLYEQDDRPGLQLNLMTCSGEFNAEDVSFDHRLLVTTQEVL